jgi:hypothetical protein
VNRVLVQAAVAYLKDPTPGRRAVLCSIADEYTETIASQDERFVLWALKQAWTAAEHELCSLLPADDGSLP